MVGLISLVANTGESVKVGVVEKGLLAVTPEVPLTGIR